VAEILVGNERRMKDENGVSQRDEIPGGGGGGAVIVND